MTSVTRLAAYAAVLAVVFAVSVLAGGAADPDASSSSSKDSHAMTTDTSTNGTSSPHADDRVAGQAGTATAHAEAAHGGHGDQPAAQTAAAKGLAVSDGGYTLELADRELPAGQDTRLAFRILDDAGDPVRAFKETHERRMHLIIVRRDGTGFQHLHPALDADGTWTARLRFAEPGSYRVFADFATKDAPATLGADLAVDGDARYRPLPAARTTTVTASGYEVRLSGGRGARAGRAAELAFTISKDGHAVHPEPYLGAGGHLVALREGDLAFLHTHPADHADPEPGGGEGGHDDAVRFETGFPSAGRYRLFLQFKAAGEVHTAEFTQEVAR